MRDLASAPPGSDERRLQERVNVALDSSTRLEGRRRARERGLSFSAYLRELIRRDALGSRAA